MTDNAVLRLFFHRLFMPSTPLVSIVMPCYNAQEFLREAIDSALAQTWPAIEVIAVDDCSTDGTPDILSDYERHFPNFRRSRHTVNRRIAATRNTGFALSHGEYIAWLDSDDYLAPDFVATMMSRAAELPGGIVAGPWRKVRLSGGVWKPDPRAIVNTSADGVLRRMLSGGWPLHCMACLFPRQVFDAVGGWDESLHMHEDRLLMSQVCIRRFPVVFAQESCVFYRIREGSLATKRTEAISQSMLQVAGRIERELLAAGLMSEFANDFAHFLDLYYIDSLPDQSSIAAAFLAMRNRVCPQYRDLRAVHSRVARSVLGDRLFARLARVLGTAGRR